MNALASVLSPASRFVEALNQSRLLPAGCVIAGVAGATLQRYRTQKQETALEAATGYFNKIPLKDREPLFVMQELRKAMILPAFQEAMTLDLLKRMHSRVQTMCLKGDWVDRARNCGREVVKRAGERSLTEETYPILSVAEELA